LLTEESYPREFYGELLAGLRSLDTDSVEAYLKKEIDRQSGLNRISNAVNLKIILGKLKRESFPSESAMLFRSAISQAKDNDLAYEIAVCYLQLGLVYEKSGNNEEALRNYILATKSVEQEVFPDLNFQLLTKQASVYYSSDNHKEALEALERAVEQFELDEWRHKDRASVFGIMSAYNTLALVQTRLNLHDEAKENFRIALQFAESIQNKFWIGLIKGNAGWMFLKDNMLDTAEVLIREDMATSLSFGAFESASGACVALAELFGKTERKELAETFYDSAKSLIDRNQLTSLQYYQSRARFAYSQGNYKQAIDLELIAGKMKDSLALAKNTRELLLLNSSIEFQLQMEELNLLEKENQIKNEEIKYKNVLIYGGFFIILLTVALLVVVYRRNHLKVRLNKELGEKVTERTKELAKTVKELDTFIYRLSHDFRRPLTTLLGLAALHQKTQHDQESDELFDKVGRVARQMDRMLHKMGYVHEINHCQTTATEIRLYDMVSTVVRDFSYDDFEQFKDAVMLDFPKETKVSSNQHLLELILINLIENSLIFHEARAGTLQVIVSFSSTDNQWQLQVSDNGVGIPEPLRAQIFDPFFKGSWISQGNGLGLYIVKKAVEKLGGTIEFAPAENGGSVFTLIFKNER
jgi:signal transduction histidine kinase